MKFCCLLNVFVFRFQLFALVFPWIAMCRFSASSCFIQHLCRGQHRDAIIFQFLICGIPACSESIGIVSTLLLLFCVQR